MHDHHMTSCNDARQACAWLRAYAIAVSAAVAARWLLGWLPGFIVFVANVRARIVYGRTAVLRPVLTGGVDHGLAAMLRGRNPMAFGGSKHSAAECCAPRRRVPVVKVFVSAKDWYVVRRWRLVRHQTGMLCDSFCIFGGRRT